MNTAEAMKVFEDMATKYVALRDVLTYLANKNNWIVDDGPIRVKIPGGARQIGIVLLSHDVEPWAFCGSALDSIDGI